METKNTEENKKNEKVSENLEETAKSFLYGTIIAFIFGTLILIGCIIVVFVIFTLILIYMDAI